MKNRNTRKSFSQSKARTHQRNKQKQKMHDELMRLVQSTNVGFDSLVIKDSLDGGRRGRVSQSPHRDERQIVGVFSGSRSGFGFVTPDPECAEGIDRDIFIPEDKTLGAIDGDRVDVIFHTYTTRFGEKKTEGRVKKILEYGRKTLIGELSVCRYSHRGSRYVRREYTVIPSDHHISLEPILRNIGDAAVGDKVEVRLLRTAGAREVECEIIRNFGPADSREANYGAILAECGIETDFSPAELSEAEFFAALPLSEEGRVRRTETIFTIDGEGAKDLDDAVSVRRLKNGWQLGVHIADVSCYVRERTHLDRAVMARGTSVYFTDKVVPMLPRALSNGACSLNPGEDKYTLSAIINLSSCGDIISTRLEPSIIRSRVRGVYSEVNDIFNGRADAAIKAKYRPVMHALSNMRELYIVLKKKSDARGCMELESAEAEILLDEFGEPYDIVRRERGDAEKLIEQFMICANEAVAKYLSDQKLPCVYRVHEAPPEDKLSDFLTYAHNLGFDISGISKEAPSPKMLSGILDAARERGLEYPVSYTLLRSMSKAKYSEKRSMHFGLGLEYYAHFTSPIRRLSDLATHRIIHRVLLEGKDPGQYEKYARRAASAATEAELRALSAERQIENLYKTIYMQKYLGECFDGMINSVTAFGMFVELPNTCEGLVPLSELCGVFTFDEKNISLRSRDITYRIGDPVKVRLEECDISRGKLRFSIVDFEN